MTTAPTSIERPLGGSETSAWITSRACPVNVVFAAEVVGPLTPSALVEGLRAVQVRHPLLRATVVADAEGTLWFRAVDGEIPVRIVEGVDWRAEVDVELSEPMPEGAPLARCVLVPRRGERAVVLFVFHHVIGDGISGSALMQDLLAAMGGSLDGQPSELPPLEPRGSLEAHLPPMGTWLSRVWAVVLVFARILRGGEPRQIPRDAKVPYPQRRARFGVSTFEGAIVAAIAKRARAEGASVYAALYAALSLAIVDELGAARPARVNCGTPVNLRPQLEPPVGDAFGLYVALTPVVMDVDPKRPFWDIAREAKGLLAAALERGDHLAISSLFGAVGRVMRWLGRGPRGADRIASFTEAMGTPTYTLSNVGSLAVQDAYGPLRLRSLLACGGGTLANHFAVTSITVGSVLQCAYVWTDPLVAPARARRIMDRARARLEGAVATTDPHVSANA